MRRIAVTGGNGLLGRYVVAALEPDYEVSVIDRVETGVRQPHGAVDVLDLAALGGALDGQDAVVHWPRSMLPTTRLHRSSPHQRARGLERAPRRL